MAVHLQFAIKMIMSLLIFLKLIYLLVLFFLKIFIQLKFTSSVAEFCLANICNSLTGFNLPLIALKSLLITDRSGPSFRIIGIFGFGGGFGDDGRRLYTAGRSDDADKRRDTSSPGIILFRK